MFNVQLYISGVRVDLFEDESISVTDAIKDLRDPKKIFTPFSMPFSVPASATNNTIFKHYYNPNIVGGFDGRKYTSAELRVGGLPYKKGSIVLNEVKMKRGNPSSYSIVFIGQGRGLTEALKDDKLSTLSYLDKYDHDYSKEDVLSGLTIGLAESAGSMIESATADVIYPLIYHAPNLSYALDMNTTVVNDQDSDGVYYKYLKPSIKVLNIIDAIEVKTGVTFSSDFFTTSNAAIDDLYLHLHNKKGQITGGSEYQEKNYTYATAFSAYTLPDEQQTILLDVDIDATGTGTYGVQIIDDDTGTIVMDLVGDANATQPQSFNKTLTALDREYSFTLRIFTEGGITAYDIDRWRVTERLVDISGTTDTNTDLITALNAEVPISTVKITSQLPDIKIIDFLTGIFQAFNLVAYYTSDTDVFVDTLDNFYADSTVEWDLTNYAHFDQHTIKRSQLFGKIDFGWNSNESYLVSRRNEIIGVRSGGGYGYSVYYGNDDEFVFDGEDYEIELPFEKFLFERIDTDYPYIYGLYLEDDDEDPGPYKGSTLIHYASNIVVGAGEGTLPIWTGDKVAATGATYTDSTIGNGNTYDEYWAAYNSDSGGNYLWNWDSETDEYSLSENLNSLFALYHDTYIGNIYDISTRIFEIKAQLPQKILTQYALNDRVILWGNKFKINSIDVDITTGEASLILITE